MQNTPSSELQDLRREVRELREELTRLREFIRITPADAVTGTPATAQVRCSSLVLVSRDATPAIQAVLGSSPQGGQFALKDAEGNSRLQLDASGATVLDANGAESASIGCDPETGMGRVLVSEAGNPRAVLKAISSGGCVSVLHDDGKPRGALLSTAHDGADLLLITPDLRPGVRITSGAPNGGLISIHRTNGSPAVSLMCGQTAAGMTIRKPDGKTKIIS